MASYKRFEEVPVWQKAITLATKVFGLTSHAAFKFRGDLVNQIRRAALSVSNNIAEGYERGTTADLIHFLYIARGSCGETRSMTRLAAQLGGMEDEMSGIEEVASLCESVSRQLFGWIDTLQHTEIEGVRHLTVGTRKDFILQSAREEFKEKFGPEATSLAIREGRLGEFNKAKLEALMTLKAQARESTAKTTDTPCPLCGGKMVKRHDRNGRPFWGCAAYPRCKGSRDWGSQS